MDSLKRLKVSREITDRLLHTSEQGLQLENLQDAHVSEGSTGNPKAKERQKHWTFEELNGPNKVLEANNPTHD